MKLESSGLLGKQVVEIPLLGRAKDVHFHFGVKRGLLYRWVKEGKVRSVSLREPGRAFGVRLFHLHEIRDRLLKMMAEQNGEVEL